MERFLDIAGQGGWRVLKIGQLSWTFMDDICVSFLK